MNKCFCNECGWKGAFSEALRAPNPFVSDETIDGCPNCKDINTLRSACFDAVEQRVLDLINPAEFRELAEWARAVPDGILSRNSPNAKHFKRIARILEYLAKLAAVPNGESK